MLAARGLADGFLGHVSLRVDERRLLVRCRGPEERGLAFTTGADIRLVDLDGQAGAAGELDGGYGPPNELPLHTEVLRTRPDVAAVVHAHPPDVVAADLAGIAIRPIVGAFDIPATRLAAGGVPVYPRGVLIRNRRLAGEMVAAMGDRPVVVLRGHGLTSAGESVESAVLQAVGARPARPVVAARGRRRRHAHRPAGRRHGRVARPRTAFNTSVAWRHELGRLGGMRA